MNVTVTAKKHYDTTHLKMMAIYFDFLLKSTLKSANVFTLVYGMKMLPNVLFATLANKCDSTK